MTFDGEYLHVFGDGEEIYTFPAYSGNPTRLSKEDAAACGANQITDSYMNDPRFVGVQDKGPIPEATYSFSPAGIERWGLGAQIALLTHLGGPPQVRSHPGDWGPGRVALNKVTATREGPCPSRGKTKDRFGFFLHGGWLRGSAGCIDIQGQFTTLADFLSGFKKPVLVTVAYKEKTGPFVPYWTGLSGGLNYMTFGFQHGPRLDVGAEFGGVSGTPRALASIAYEGTLAWAGGALSAGLHLDVSMNDKETFVRTGLLGATNARLLKGLYARVFLGPSWLVSGQGSRDARLELGGGLQYDFGRIHLEALYDVLMPMKDDPEVHRVMLGVGMRF